MFYQASIPGCVFAHGLSFIIYIFCSINIFTMCFVGAMFALVVLSCVNLEVINKWPFGKTFAELIIHFRIGWHNSFCSRRNKYVYVFAFSHSSLH